MLPELPLFTWLIDCAADPSLKDSFFDTSLTPLLLFFTSFPDDPKQGKQPILSPKNTNPPQNSLFLSLDIFIYINSGH